MNDLTERQLWALINGLGWWYWGPIAFLAACNMWNIFRLAPAASLYGRLIRTCALTGFLLIAMSWGNTAFGPLGMPFVLLSYLGMTHQLYLRCKAEGLIQHPPPATTGLRIISTLVEHK